MVTRRQIREAGHRRKFLAVADNTPECGRAVHYAARRAAAIDADLVLVYVIVPGDFQHWLGVEEVMRSEARAESESVLQQFSNQVLEQAGITAELVTREGAVDQEIVALIEEDRDIALMILAASDDKDGPGPLVSSVTATAASFPIPVTIVPCTLSDKDIDDLV